jgi:hypothetical protein
MDIPAEFRATQWVGTLSTGRPRWIASDLERHAINRATVVACDWKSWCALPTVVLAPYLLLIC